MLVEKGLALFARRQLRVLAETADDPGSAQRTVLRELVNKAVDTEWGRRYGYSRIRTPEEFRAAVPLMRYEDMVSWWHGAFDGDRDLTWPGHIRYFALSSGTTAGNKLLPVTRDAIRSNRRAGGMLLSLLVARGGAESLANGRFFYLGGSTTLRKRGKSLYGDASGIMGRHIPVYARNRYLPDASIGALTDWEEKINRVIARYLRSDACALSACPSWAALLLKRLREEGGAPVSELWRKLRFFVSYGMAFEPYRKAFDEYIGKGVHYVDTYSSSEGGMTAIQEEDGGPMRLLVDNGVYFEFIPEEKVGESDPPRLHMGEVEEGKNYSMVLSSNGGIWAYPLGDVVRFESIRPPRIRFAGRTAVYLSAFGEHVTIEMIEKAMADASRATGAVPADYTIVPIFPSAERAKPGHRWIVEFEREPDDAGRFMRLADDSIRSENEDYDTHRKDDYGMTPPELCVVPGGTFYRWMKARGQLGGQHKVPRVLPSQAAAEELLGCR